jgi:hypothetical protein
MNTEWHLRTPVAFIIFNRPDTTARVFEEIRRARPSKLLVVADGPRIDLPGETEKCAAVRAIIDTVDWPCDVLKNYSDTNLGCKRRVSSGLDWVFQTVEAAIILEDDVLPLQSFFPYCDELLERYRENEKVAVISGNNLISKRFHPQDSYFFSRYNHVWGWASWRRAWRLYDVTIQSWPVWRDKDGLKSISDGSKLFESYWRDIFNNTYSGGVDTWDYQWTFTCWYHGMVSALPAHNQTHNLGFGADATHVTDLTPDYVKESIPETLTFPLRHPIHIERIAEADALIDRRVFGITQMAEIKRIVRNIPVVGDVLGKRTSISNVNKFDRT